ncbi:ABC transporter ATP-binding protein [Vibrio barjaei]|uniref:ABC transporter ATP-binding protein n=1 Tax=Vibrio barjaei TaxID=1676683 RepID=UPI0022845388|nr:ABC transporter ATP-binding protein [Vibrio barjaei]MCY9872374.1 ABC transporter ATP-binding protein [Vibrio barjaei]
MISLKNVSKWYPTKLGKKTVLERVDFEFPAGKDVAVMGKNGAGKSTLLRMLGRADYPSSGEIVHHVKTSWPLGLSGGYQPSLTARDNTIFVCKIYGIEDISRRVEFVKEFSELGQNFELPVKTYSSGMRSKFVFALSMALDFDLYLIDEVLAVGDKRFQKKCKDVLDSKREQSNIILVAHSEQKMRQHCDYGVVVDNGKITGYEDLEEALAIYREL